MSHTEPEPASRRLVPTILHADMDAFFASVEILENPELAGKPLIVGGDGGRGVVASCNYEARRYGVRSAMPSSRAKRLCPHAVFVRGRYGAYEEYSEQMHEVFTSFTPLVEGISLDEAFLDIAGALRLFGTPERIAKEIRRRVKEEMRLDVCVGGATTKHLAKLASEAAKPRATRRGIDMGEGVMVLQPDSEMKFLHALPVSAIWGVGKVTAQKLETIGITTVSQLAHAPEALLAPAVGKASAHHLLQLAWNRDSRAVQPTRAAKSIGHEQTYAQDLHRGTEVHDQIVRLADAVSSRLRERGLEGRTVTVKIRFASFETITRSETVEATAASAVIRDTALALAAKADPAAGIRLLGISVSQLNKAAPVEEQLEFDGSRPTDEVLDRAVDAIRTRYGPSSVMPAPLVRPGSRVFRPGERQWGPTPSDGQ